MSAPPGFDLVDSSAADEPLDQAIRGFQELQVPARPDDRAVLAVIRTGQSQESRLGSLTQAKPDRLPALLRYGVVAAALALLVVYAVGQRPENYLLADVADAMARHKTVRFVVEDKIPSDRNKVPITCYWTLDSMHSRLEGSRDGKLRINDYPGGRILVLDPKTKTAQVIRFDPKKIAEPKNRLAMCQVIRDERSSKASKETLAGREYLVYRLERQYGSRSTMKTLVWADPTTRLPVRIDVSDRLRDLKDPKKFYDDSIVNRDFVWDPPEIGSVGEFFSTTPPTGYTVEVIDD
jgi:hypothetical protein